MTYDEAAIMVERLGENHMQVEKTMSLGQVLQADRGTARIFMEFGMHCLGCPSSQGESLEEACMVHGIDCDALVNGINEILADK